MAESKKKVMRKEDCPSTVADPYPGKKSRNNPNGTILTKSEFIEKEVENWVEHFKNSDSYHKTVSKWPICGYT